MNDLISRQEVINALVERTHMDWESMKILLPALGVIDNLPSAEPELYGYKVEHLAYIAKVMEKEGVTAEYVVRTFDDMSRAIKMIIEEAQQKVEETLNERFNRQTGGDS